MEVWKDVVGFEGLYSVSSIGRVKSMDRISYTKNGNIRKHVGRQLKIATLPKGYKYVLLTNGETRKHYSVHRLVAIAFIPNPHNLPFVNHKLGIKNDNRVSELEWCTPLFNVKHAYLHGLMKNWTRPVIIEKDGIKRRFESQTKAAKYLGCCIASVSKHAKRGSHYQGFKITNES